MLTDINIWIGIGISIFLLIPAIALLFYNRTRQRRLMTQVAREFDCDESQPYQFRNRFYIRFVHQRVPFFASSFRLRGKHNLRVVSIWREPSFRLRLFADRLPAREKKFMALEDIAVGDVGFDRAYVINSHDETRVRQLLTQEVRDAIKNLGLDIMLNIVGNRIQLDYWIPDAELNIKPERAKRVIRQFIKIYFALNRIPYKGSALELTADELAMNLVETANSICMVCGQSIEESKLAIVQCQTCDSRHHHDCWEYFGGCSTYGCGEKLVRV